MHNGIPTFCGSAFGLHLNLAKYEIFWPSGDSTFPEFPVAVRRVGIISGGVELLGCPLWGTLNFYSDCFDRSLLRLSQAHALLGDLEDPQVELHLLHSCVGVCKITHLLRCVPPDVVQPFLPRYLMPFFVPVLIVFADVVCQIVLGARLLFLFVWVV